MSNTGSTTPDQATYWNEDGGRRWVANLDRVERMLAPLAEELVRHAAPQAGEAVLDVGCGGGLTSKAFADAVGAAGEVLGLDVSAVILAVARARFAGVPNLRFSEGDAGSLPLPEAHYDLLTSRFGVMFFPAPVAAFAHLRKALKPGGRLRFICWRELACNPWMGIAVETAFRILPRPAPTPPNAPGPFGLANETWLREVLTSAGFREVEAVAHERLLDLGPLEEAVAQMTRMGPAAPVFDEAPEETRAKVRAALGEALAPSLTAGRVWLPGSTWLVSARP